MRKGRYNNPATGINTIQVGGFSTEVQVVSNAGITFTSVSQNTAAAYIFGNNPVAPTLVIANFTSTDISMTDLSLVSPDFHMELASGQSVGLAHIEYTLASSVPLSGPGSQIAVMFVSGGTTISGADGVAALTISGPNDGTITAVPEPGTLVLAGLLSGVGGVLVVRRRTRS